MCASVKVERTRHCPGSGYTLTCIMEHSPKLRNGNVEGQNGVPCQVFNFNQIKKVDNNKAIRKRTGNDSDQGREREIEEQIEMNPGITS